MSSSQSNEIRKMSSISRRIQRIWIGEKIRHYISMDICLVVFIFVVFYATCSLDKILEIGSFDSVQIKEAFDSLILEKAFVLRKKYILMPMMMVCETIAVFQILCLIFSSLRNRRRLKRILEPINDLAIKADELTKLSFDDDKYRLLEDAILNVSPDEDEKIIFNNAELQGVEAAMNNLLTRMRESYRQQARFVNDASHELRTPIAVIEGYANMLSRWGKEDEKVLEESINAIKTESGRMKALVEQLLFLARGDSGKTIIKREEIILNDLMNEIYEESLMIDEEHAYKFKNLNDFDVIKCVGDYGLLKQAVRILVDNATKYTAKGDEITLSVGREDASRIYLQVQDMGIGMDKEAIEHMFERFYRADEARSKDGTGLGLSIAKWIVDKHKGYFEITSRIDLGTRIKIILPI